MKKHTYTAPHLKVMAESEEALLAGTYRLFDEDEDGEALGKSGLYDAEAWPQMPDVWDDDNPEATFSSHVKELN